MCANENFQLPNDVDLAFITIHGTFGEDGQLQKILEDRGVAYTGDGVEGERDRVRQNSASKEKFREHEVATPQWEVIDAGQRPTMSVAARGQGAATGLDRGCRHREKRKRARSAIAEAAKYDRELLIEKFVSGRELTIGILGDQALPILEIIPKGGFYDFNNKYPFLNPTGWRRSAQHVCPANIDADNNERNSGAGTPGISRRSACRFMRASM